MRLGRDRDALLGVEDDDVGVAADRDRPLLRIHPEQLRRVRREQLDHAVQRDPPFAHAEVVDHLQPVLDPDRAVRDLAEVVLPERLLLAACRRSGRSRSPGARSCARRSRGSPGCASGAAEACTRTSRASKFSVRSRNDVSTKKYCVQVSPQTSQPFSRAIAIGSTRLARTRRGRRRAARRRRARAGSHGSSPRPRSPAGASARARSASVLPAAIASLDEHVDRVAVLGVHHHAARRSSRRPPSTRKSVSSSTRSESLYAMKSL